jgi:hypothetical protein
LENELDINHNKKRDKSDKNKKDKKKKDKKDKKDKKRKEKGSDEVFEGGEFSEDPEEELVKQP